MKIQQVTVTGADDKVSHSDLIDISKKYPFVEWGILFSPKRQGTARYPSIEWVNKLRDTVEELNLNRKTFVCSAHLCGDYTRQIITEGNPSKFRDDSGIKHPQLFWRHQLNFNSQNTPVDYDKLYFFFKGLGNNTILQYNNSNEEICKNVIEDCKNYKLNRNGIHFLYDGSGGRGVMPNQWKGIVPNHFTGYAGGLNPHNLKEALEEINKSVGDNTIWIDTETGVRTNDNLDLDKVVKFIEIASKYTE